MAAKLSLCAYLSLRGRLSIFQKFIVWKLNGSIAPSCPSHPSEPGCSQSAARADMSAQDVREVENLKGYASLEDYKRRKEQMAQDATLKSMHATANQAVGLQGAAAAAAEGEVPAKKKRKKAKGGGVLSFGDEEEGDGADGEAAASEPPAAKKVFKAPGVDTSFLAKNASEKEDAAKVQQARLRVMLDGQDRAKSEEVDMHYIFRNEQAKKLLSTPFYRGHVRVRRGDTVTCILEAVHKKLAAELKEPVSSALQLAVSNEYHQLIMQNHMSLFDIFALEWREGKPMFEFGPSTIAIAERAFFEINHHLYPMNGWVLFDPFKKYSFDETVRNRDKTGVGVEVFRGPQQAKGGQRAK